MAHEEKDIACVDCSYWEHVEEIRVKMSCTRAEEAGKSLQDTGDLYMVEGSG